MEMRNTPHSLITNTQTAPMLKPKENQRNDLISDIAKYEG